jgi:Na+-driven multidrug efflux pump
MWKKRERFDFELKLSYFKMDGDIMKVLIRLGIPQVVRSLFVRFGMLWVNSNANSYGLVVSATNSVGNKLQKFLEVFIQGIDTASASMVGQNLGAKKTERAGKTTLCTAFAAVVCAAASGLLCLLFPHQIFGIFTKDEAVIILGATFLRIFILHFFASAITGSFQAMVTGCGFVELGFVLGILDGVICKIGLSILFMRVFHMGYIGLWWGVACSRILPGCICVGYYLSGKWKTRKLLTEQ